MDGVLVLSYGQDRYVDMAKTLARSLQYHSPKISRAIVTDHVDDLEVINLFDYVISVDDSHGSNVRQKLFLNKYTPFQRTLYIDSDCLVIRDINFIFEELRGKAFCAVGDRYLLPGDSDKYIDVDFALKHFNLERIPKFNGGIYYFEKNDKSDFFFVEAQRILANYKSLGFKCFRRDGPADEPIFSIAMSLYGQDMYNDQASMMRTIIGSRGKLDLDTLNSHCCFRKYDMVVSPAIVHFPHVWSQHPAYRKDAYKLKDIPSYKSGKIYPLRLKVYDRVYFCIYFLRYFLRKLFF